MPGDSVREWSLLAKYLVKEATEEERLKVEALLKENEDLRHDFQKLASVYYYDHGTNPIDTTEFFNKLNSRIKKKGSLE